MSKAKPGPTLRLALAQIDPTVGALWENAELITGRIADARSAGADLVLFPELALTGYPPEDLLLKPEFLSRSRHVLSELAGEVEGVTAVVGTVEPNSRPYNAAAVLRNGEVRGWFRKSYLPNYGVFDEKRYFAAGRSDRMLDVGGVAVAVTICEDVWYPEGPATRHARDAGAELILNLSCSPFHRGKGSRRERMLGTRASDSMAFLAFCNLVGGQDELVFDGRSALFSPDGDVLARAPSFESGLVVADVDLAKVRRRRLREPRRPGHGADGAEFEWISVPGSQQGRRPAGSAAEKAAPPEEEEEVYRALELGVRDYVRKNGFEDVVVGLSGGIDSALTVTVAADALGPERVTAVTMPTRFSSEGSIGDSRALAENLGVELLEIDVDDLFVGFIETLAPHFEGTESGVAEENLQPRIRGTILMALSNKFGWLVLTAGNKSEMSVGYATLYGDTAGGFGVLKDVPKTLVYELAEWRNREPEGPVIPRAILAKPPSAELRDDQRDTDSLPPYEELDPILEAYVEENRGEEEIVELGFDAETVGRVVCLVDRAEYKRRQTPPGPKVTSRAFGKDWRLPITNRFG